MIQALGIVNASTRTVQQAAQVQPTMRDTITGWSEPITIVRLLKKLVNFENASEEKPYSAMGMVQPFSARELQIKPEGQRGWKWYMLHCTIEVDLRPGEKFILNGSTFVNMSDNPYFRNGYFEYQIYQTFS